MTLRLSDATLDRTAASVQRPQYVRPSTKIGIVHFGPGAFHRAHQAVYFDTVLAEDPRWAECAVALRSPGLSDALTPQDGLYTLVTAEAEPHYRIIGACREHLHAPSSPAAVLARLTAPDTHLVTITISEKGYCLTPGGDLDQHHPVVAHDLAGGTPQGLIGWLCEGLRLRRAAGLRPFAAVSCDNMSDNGLRLRRAVLQFAHARDPELAAWIEGEVDFPSTMVDSITPATTEGLRRQVATHIRLVDAAPVLREPFTQWVIEDTFRGPRPDLAGAGVILTGDVQAFERAKLRLLNGAHSALAYLGLLRGYTTVHEAIADPGLEAFVRTLMRSDIAPTLSAPRGLDLYAYIASILERFRNPAVAYPLRQIAMDGSQKLPFRLLGTIVDALSRNQPLDRLCEPIAAWMVFVRDEVRAGLQLADPLEDSLRRIAGACTGAPLGDTALFLREERIFAPALRESPALWSALARSYQSLSLRQNIEIGVAS